MGKIAVIIDDWFEDIEYTKPAEVFRENGHELICVGIQAGREVKGKRNQTPVRIDAALDQAAAAEYDALFIPGGFSPDRLRAHPEAVDFVRAFMREGKPVFSICHGAQLLITAQTLEGRVVTGWKSIIQDIKNAGARYENEEVVRDGNLISSRGPDDIPAFIKASLEALERQPVKNAV